MRLPGEPSHEVTPVLRVICDYGPPVLHHTGHSRWGRYRRQRLADSHLARAGLVRRVAYRKRETPGLLLAEDDACTIGRNFAHGSGLPEHNAHGTGSIGPGRVHDARVGDKGGLWPPRSGSGRRGGASANRWAMEAASGASNRPGSGVTHRWHPPSADIASLPRRQLCARAKLPFQQQQGLSQFPRHCDLPIPPVAWLRAIRTHERPDKQERFLHRLHQLVVAGTGRPRGVIDASPTPILVDLQREPASRYLRTGSVPISGVNRMLTSRTRSSAASYLAGL
jgi:hypothetical protein